MDSPERILKDNLAEIIEFPGYRRDTRWQSTLHQQVVNEFDDAQHMLDGVPVRCADGVWRQR